MNLLTGIQGLKCLVYLDDVIYGSSLEGHNKSLVTVLHRLRNIKLQSNKCEFLRKEVIYLGNIIMENGISPHSSKLEAKKFPREIPKKIKNMQAFIDHL